MSHSGDEGAKLHVCNEGRESANYGGAILLGLTALEWEERAQHQLHWRFVTLYYIVSQTGRTRVERGALDAEPMGGYCAVHCVLYSVDYRLQVTPLSSS